MCIGDWRLGRLVTRQLTSFSRTSAQTTVINAHHQRVGIAFLLGAADVLSIQPAAVTVDGVQFGISPYTNNIFTFAEWGDLPTAQWTLTGGSAITPSTGAIIEFFMPESYLAAGVEEFMRSVAQWKR